MGIFNRKILIIGLDGATWNIFDEVINKGCMPYTQKLRESGYYSTIKSTLTPISPAAWSTIQTGIKCLKNHIYEFYTFNKVKKTLEIVNSNILEKTLWDQLSNLGKRVGILNVPMTYPPRKVNGTVISGILTPSIDNIFTYPADLKQNILEKIPDYQLKYSEDVRYGNPHYNLKKFIKKRIKNVKDRTKLMLYLFRNYKYDIFMVNFQANDILQHVAWGYMDKNNELYNNSTKNYIFKNYYKTLDFCIEVIREEFIRTQSGDLLTLILSDHGFENHIKRFYLGDWLYRNGLLKLKRNILLSIFRTKVKELLLKLNMGNIQTRLLNKFKKTETRFKKTGKTSHSNKFLNNVIDWDKTLAFSLGISLYGLIFIMRKGKEKKKITKNLINKLKSIKDPENGKRIVKKIYLKEEVYNGEHPELIPDLIIKPINGYSFTGLYQNKSNLFHKINYKQDFPIGKHSDDRIIIINGKNIQFNEQIDAKLIDIVPTILDYFKIPVSKKLEGKALFK